jgi:hypothetical protein
MCSGCAGDYAGGFDDPAEGSADSDHPRWLTWNWREPDEQGGQRKSGQTRAFEAESPQPEDWRSAIAPGPKDESAAGVCEILVSETRIIEIRMIAANDCEPMEWAAAGQHSSVASAKHYQTRRADTESTRNHAGIPCHRGISGFVGAEFGKWNRWARKAFTRSRDRDSR